MGYLAKVEGELVTKDGKGSAISFYEEEFILDISKRDTALCVIQNGLLNEKLRRKVDNFRRWRTCQIVSFTKVTDKAKHSKLDVLLTEAVKLQCLPETLENYREAKDKEKALTKAITLAKKRLEKEEEEPKKKPGRPPKITVEDLGYVD